MEAFKFNSSIDDDYDATVDSLLFKDFKQLMSFQFSPPQLNFSCFDFPFEIWTVLPASEIVAKTFILFPIGVFGIIGNCLLLHVIHSNPSLRSPTNYLISNMAITDLIVLSFCPGLFVFHEIFQSYKLGTEFSSAKRHFSYWLLSSFDR